MRAIVVRHSQTRRKSCQRCAQAKRRCDLGVPRCQGCARRDFACEYVDSPDVDGDTLRLAYSSRSPLDSATSARDPFGGFYSASGNLSRISILEPDLSPYQSLYTPSRYIPSPIHYDYLATFFRNMILALALQNRSCFIHSSNLIKAIPQSLQCAISVSALWALHSPTTFTILDANLHALIDSSNHTLHSPVAILHSVQSLIIFQAIRLASLDQDQMGRAESDFTILNDWTIALQIAYFDDLQSIGTYRQWVLKESIRRTILMSVLLRSLFCTIRDGYSELVPLLASLPVSSNGGLWELDETQGLECYKGDDAEQLCTYWEFLASWSKECVGGTRGMERSRRWWAGDFEKLLLSLEEDGGVGEAGWQLINNAVSVGV